MKRQVDGQLTLFPGDSRASPYPSPGSAEAGQMTVSSGRKCLEWFRNSGPLGYVVRTCLESSVWRSTIALLTWKIKVTPCGRSFFRLVPSKPRTDGTELLFWPTPTATEADHGGPNSRYGNGDLHLSAAAVLWPTPTARDYKGSNSTEHLNRESGNRNHRDQLANAVKLWATPQARDYRTGQASRWQDVEHRSRNLNDQAAMYPTPTTGAGLCGGSGNYNQLKELEAAGEISPEERRSMAAGNGGQLNPDWVEAMMGFPTGWTVLEPDGAMEAGKPEFPA